MPISFVYTDKNWELLGSIVGKDAKALFVKINKVMEAKRRKVKIRCNSCHKIFRKHFKLRIISNARRKKRPS